MEEWRDIKGYEGLYQVSNMGRVKGLERISKHSKGGNKTIKEKILKGTLNDNRYLMVGLSKNGKTKRFLIHRLVGEAFISNPNKLPCIDHINTIATDNRAENLKWCTQKDNCNNELSKKHISENRKGKKFSKEHKKHISDSLKGYKHSKDTIEKKRNTSCCKKIINITTGVVYKSIAEASRETGINNASILNCCKGKRKTAGGYHWKYI